MFIGHFAVSFAAKRVAPNVSLAVLVAAAQLADLLWPAFLMFGIEHVLIDPGNTAFTPLDFVSYPYSHSLALLTAWGVAFGLVYVAATGRRSAWPVLAALVISHWVLDWITHGPDMPVYPGGPTSGLGLWNSVAATIVVELAMLIAGVMIYLRQTRARDGAGRWGLVALIAVLLVAYAGNIAGGPPPSLEALQVVAAGGGAVLVALSWWVDRHRVSGSSRSAP
jgi:hypothetical protein